MTIKITNQVRIQQHPGFWYTVEDTNIDVGCEGCTISYWEGKNVVLPDDKRVQYICMDEEEALAIASTILKLFKRELK
jgi:hypothetical protein